MLGRPLDPVSAARLSTARIAVALKQARRRDMPPKAKKIQTSLRSRQLD
ncbi:MAG TPA: hypothetical protein VI011_26655 [Asanoa sp.]